MSEQSPLYSVEVIERAPFVPQTGLEPAIGGLVLKDFNLSFRLSQGQEDTQRAIFSALDGVYRETWTPRAMSVFAANIDAFRDRAESLALPPDHSGPINDTLFQFTEQWAIFSTQIKYGHHPTGQDLRYVIQDVGRDMISADRSYLARPGGRPGAKSPEALYASHFRDYVLHAKPTGSHAFGIIMDRLRGDAKRNEAQFMLYSLQRDWQLRNPGRDFYPSDWQDADNA